MENTEAMGSDALSGLLEGGASGEGGYAGALVADFVPEENLRSFADAAQKAGISAEQAQALLDWHKGQAEAQEAEERTALGVLMEEWKEELRGDAEFGGALLGETVAGVRRALEAFDPSGELADLLNKTGYIYHPAVLRTAARAGARLAEQRITRTKGFADNMSLEDRMYKAM